MGIKKWQIAGFDKTLAKELAEECDIDLRARIYRSCFA